MNIVEPAPLDTVLAALAHAEAGIAQAAKATAAVRKDLAARAELERAGRRTETPRVSARLSGDYVDIEHGLLGRRVGEAFEEEDGRWTFVPWPGAYTGETWRPTYRTAVDMLEAIAESWPKPPTVRFRAVKTYDLTVQRSDDG